MYLLFDIFYYQVMVVLRQHRCSSINFFLSIYYEYFPLNKEETVFYM